MYHKKPSNHDDVIKWKHFLANDEELWCDIWCAPEQTVEQTVELPES